MARDDPTIYMRIPQELKHSLDKAAFVNRRSLTAEVVARLQSSLEGTAGMPAAIEQAIKHEQGERGGTRDEALTRLVLAGQAQGGTVVNLRVGPGTSIPKLHAILDVTMKALPPDAKSVVTLDATQPD